MDDGPVMTVLFLTRTRDKRNELRSYAQGPKQTAVTTRQSPRSVLLTNRRVTEPAT